jgi:hypothetical protein
MENEYGKLCNFEEKFGGLYTPQGAISLNISMRSVQ